MQFNTFFYTNNKMHDTFLCMLNVNTQLYFMFKQ